MSVHENGWGTEKMPGRLPGYGSSMARTSHHRLTPGVTPQSPFARGTKVVPTTAHFEALVICELAATYSS